MTFVIWDAELPNKICKMLTWLHYTTINKITQLYKKQIIYYHLTYWLDHIILVVHQLGFSIYIFKVVHLLLNTCREIFFFMFVSEPYSLFFWFDTWIRPNSYKDYTGSKWNSYFSNDAGPSEPMKRWANCPPSVPFIPVHGLQSPHVLPWSIPFNPCNFQYFFKKLSNFDMILDQLDWQTMKK